MPNREDAIRYLGGHMHVTLILDLPSVHVSVSSIDHCNTSPALLVIHDHGRHVLDRTVRKISQTLAHGKY